MKFIILQFRVEIAGCASYLDKAVVTVSSIMIAYQVVAVVVGILAPVIGSSACFYSLYTISRKNLSILEQKVKDLKGLLKDISEKFNEGGVFRPDPSTWIGDVENFIMQHNHKDLGGCLHESCINGVVPNICHQCRTWKLIEEDTKMVYKLLKDGEDLKLIGFRRSCKKMFGDSVKKIKDEIWEEVSREKGVQVVCIRGIVGVGKTLMASTIHNKALEEEDLESVIWVSIDYKSTIKDIQKEIARQLPDLNLSACTDDSRRALTLQGALSSKKCLLILDYSPMWQDFQLDCIGIPSSGDKCKLIVASRSYSACNKLESSFGDRSRVHEIKPLLPYEAWKLFFHEAGPNIWILEGDIHKNTELAVKDLDGLPSAINILATALKEIPKANPDKIIEAWERELFVLSTSGSLLGYKSHKFFSDFEDIFENLDEKSLSCFVYCLLFPKDCFDKGPNALKAKELIEYWMWEGLLDDQVSSLNETMGYGWNVLNNLRDAHLVEIVAEEDGRSEELVRMLNIIRLVAKNVAVTRGHQLFVKCGNYLKELPLAKDWPPNTERASFVQNELGALQSGPDCINLSTLLLQDNKPLGLNRLIVSHDDFFSKLVNLRVLNLSYTGFSSLPKSLADLVNLRALILRNCSSLTHLPSLSKFHKLFVLDLAGTPLRELPVGFNSLSNLRRLDLSQTKLKFFRPGKLGQLTQIEELLLMCNCKGILKQRSNRVSSAWKGLCIDELKNLKRLAVLQLNFLDTAVLRDFLQTSEFEKNAAKPGAAKQSFKFFVGGIYNSDNRVIGKDSVTIVQDHEATLPKGTKELNMMSCAKKLPSLNIAGCCKYLTKLDVSDYNELEYVLTWEVLQKLKKLKKIQVKRCRRTVSIIKPDIRGKHVDLIVPELTTLLLSDLPELKNISDYQVLNCPSLQEVEVRSCGIMELPEIILGGEREIKIRGDKKWLEKAKKRNQNSSSTFKYEEIPQLAEELSFTSELPIPSPDEQPNNDTGDTWGRWGLKLIFKGGLAYLPTVGSLDSDNRFIAKRTQQKQQQSL